MLKIQAAKTTTKIKNVRIIFAKEIIDMLNVFQLYEKQQNNDNIEIIR